MMNDLRMEIPPHVVSQEKKIVMLDFNTLYHIGASEPVSLNDIQNALINEKYLKEQVESLKEQISSMMEAL